MNTHTYIDKTIVATGNGDLEEWSICTANDGFVLAKTYSEYLAKLIQKTIEDDLEKNGMLGWE